MVKFSSKVRDVCSILQYFREFLLGRRHVLHGRFPKFIAPRTIPPPDVPRSPEVKLSQNYYYTRSAFDSVHPPVVAPVAEGPPIAHDKRKKAQGGGMRPDAVYFATAPTPGLPWWWDGHCYYEYFEDPPQHPCPQINFMPPCPDQPNLPQPPPSSTCPPGYPPCPPTHVQEPFPPSCPRP